MLTHPVRDKVTKALTTAGLDPMDVLLLLDDVCREDRNNRAKLTYPQGRQYLVNVLTSMQGGARLSDIEATATEAAEQIGAEAIAEIAVLRELVTHLVDPDPCDLDHHGYCQAHGWTYTEPACPMARAAELGLGPDDEEARRG